MSRCYSWNRTSNMTTSFGPLACGISTKTTKSWSTRSDSFPAGDTMNVDWSVRSCRLRRCLWLRTRRAYGPTETSSAKLRRTRHTVPDLGMVIPLNEISFCSSWRILSIHRNFRLQWGQRWWDGFQTEQPMVPSGHRFGERSTARQDYMRSQPLCGIHWCCQILAMDQELYVNWSTWIS